MAIFPFIWKSVSYTAVDITNKALQVKHGIRR